MWRKSFVWHNDNNPSQNICHIVTCKILFITHCSPPPVCHMSNILWHIEVPHVCYTREKNMNVRCILLKKFQYKILDIPFLVDTRPSNDYLNHFLFKKIWHVTLDTWHVTCDTWHTTYDTWPMTGGEYCVKISGL